MDPTLENGSRSDNEPTAPAGVHQRPEAGRSTAGCLPRLGAFGLAAVLRPARLLGLSRSTTSRSDRPRAIATLASGMPRLKREDVEPLIGHRDRVLKHGRSLLGRRVGWSRRDVLFVTGWKTCDIDEAAIAALPERAWVPAVDQAGEVQHAAHVAEITGLDRRLAPLAGRRYQIAATNIIALADVPGSPPDRHPGRPSRQARRPDPRQRVRTHRLAAQENARGHRTDRGDRPPEQRPGQSDAAWHRHDPAPPAGIPPRAGRVLRQHPP